MRKEIACWSALFLAICFLSATAFAQSDACSPTIATSRDSIVNIPGVGTPKTPSGGVADGWVLLYKDSSFKQIQNEVYCHANKIQFTSSVGKKNFNAQPNCKAETCTRAVKANKVSQVKLTGRLGNSNQFKWGPHFLLDGFTVLHDFAGGSSDGQWPYAGLTEDSSGNLYGTTEGGGATGYGTLYELTNAATPTVSVLYNFLGKPDGSLPYAAPVFDSKGNLYGTTNQGGANGNGSLYELSASGTESVLYSFNSANTNGYGIYAGLTIDSSNNLYGAAVDGGTDYDGTLFEWNSSGVFSALYQFQGSGASDGAYPYNVGSMAMDASGNLYGTTYKGGIPGGPYSGNFGTVFEYNPTTATETVLYEFQSIPNGAHPFAGVTIDASGNLYGTTYGGGASNEGTVWELSPNGSGGYTHTILYSFTGGNDGGMPYGGVALDSAGNIYGVAEFGGANNTGTLYEISASGTFSVLHTFASMFNSSATDGFYPYAVMLASDGNLYGTSSSGGTGAGGAIWGYQLVMTPTTTTTTVTSSLNPSAFGQTVTFTAAVTGQGKTPTGTVTFYDVQQFGTVTLGTQTLSGGTAQYSTSALAVATHSITAVYSGSGSYQGSTSAVLSQVVNPASQTIAFTMAPPAKAADNNSFWVAATSTSGLPVSLTGSGACYPTLATVSPVEFTMDVSKGTCTVTATQAGNTNYLAASPITGTTTVAKAGKPTVTLTGAPTSAAYNTSFTVVATPSAYPTPAITATPSTVCTISGTTVTMTSGTGKCTVEAVWPAYADYTTASVKLATTAVKASSGLAWATPSAITYGTKLSSTQLDATASVAGTFKYSPAAGTEPKVPKAPATCDTLKVTFTPALSADYTTQSTSVCLVVNPAN
jgi:uncharacterized repeat protein (TIGR03803 family)